MSDTDKVEVLAKRVLNEVVHIDRQLSETAAIYEVDLVQSLVSASFHEGYCAGEAKGHAEGVAEGAERALNKLARYAKRVDGGEYSYAFGKPFYAIPVTAFAEVFASVLAPTKESEK